MSWFKVDDEFYDHEKVVMLAEGPCEDNALALWLKCGNWCARAEKDGHVPSGVAKRFANHPEAASELVRVGLWHRAGVGYVFHDWADYQPSGERLEERRRKGAERKAQSRARLSTKRSVDVSVSQRDCVSVTGVPRTGLAPASRDRALDLNSPSEISEQIPIQSFRPPLGDPPHWVQIEKPTRRYPDAARVNDLYAAAMNKDAAALGAQDPEAPGVIARAARVESGEDDKLFVEVVERFLRTWKADPKSVTHKIGNLAQHIGKYTREKKAPPKPTFVPQAPPEPEIDPLLQELFAEYKTQAVA